MIIAILAKIANPPISASRKLSSSLQIVILRKRNPSRSGGFPTKDLWTPPQKLGSAKKQLTIRLDEDALNWLKSHGKGHQTRINRILRVVMESQPPRTARS
jgi:uncharacterized protein (DUF4415 family)